MSVATLPAPLARLIGAAPPTQESEAPNPDTNLDWALHWATGRHHLHVFPCSYFLGKPLVTSWFKKATFDASTIVEWWSDMPDADIAVVPQLSGHYIISAVGLEGARSLEALEAQYGQLEPDFVTVTRWDTAHYWFKGEALSSHHKLGRNLHVYGPGRYIYLPPSAAPLAIE